jgi:hypothetical protein
MIFGFGASADITSENMETKLKNPTAMPSIHAIFLCITITSFFKVISLLVPVVPGFQWFQAYAGLTFKSSRFKGSRHRRIRES